MTLNEVDEYTGFSLDLDYIDNRIPDTVIIEFSKVGYGFDTSFECFECSHVFFDNLQLLENLPSFTENSDEFSIEFMPNPINDFVILTTYNDSSQFQYIISTIEGKPIKKRKN